LVVRPGLLAGWGDDESRCSLLLNKTAFVRLLAVPIEAGPELRCLLDRTEDGLRPIGDL
jgi:hypothetical protein